MSSTQMTGLTGIFVPIVALYFIKASHDVMVKWMDTRVKISNMCSTCVCARVEHNNAMNNLLPVSMYTGVKKTIDENANMNNKKVDTPTQKPLNVNDTAK